jgi:hypothetical protein
MEDETVTEKVSGSLPVTAGLTLLASVAVTPLAALLPVLASTLANGRQISRIEKAIREAESDLLKYGDKIKDIEDGQYKVINETILTILQTVDESKLRYLRNVINNTLKQQDVISQESEILSRIIRDMSGREIRFIIDNRKYQKIRLTGSETGSTDEQLSINPDSDDGITTTGLISLGLLIPGESTWAGAGMLRFARIVPKLIVLLEKENS